VSSPELHKTSSSPTANLSSTSEAPTSQSELNWLPHTLNPGFLRRVNSGDNSVLCLEDKWHFPTMSELPIPFLSIGTEELQTLPRRDEDNGLVGFVITPLLNRVADIVINSCYLLQNQKKRLKIQK
jgi:hypothetical protein